MEAIDDPEGEYRIQRELDADDLAFKGGKPRIKLTPWKKQQEYEMQLLFEKQRKIHEKI